MKKGFQPKPLPTSQDDKEKYFEMGEHKTRYKLNKFLEENKCSGCWLTNKHCICNKIEKVELENEYFVFFHFKEFLRGSNTGKLLPLSVGIPSFPFPFNPIPTRSNVQVFIGGVHSSEQLFKEEISKRDLPNIAILYPSENSIKITDWIQQNTHTTQNFETTSDINNNNNNNNNENCK
eukprot:TRINITY_DN4213_c0_g1_i3.p1 TRINITY_DN4213_c0_g1~~TRINITY_DN4213_c0_g1_i3.p1  ORF type:complete len:178 (-),score=47.84 TRINITY_DN4213_c0_g1_i3:654-1187(-)